MYLLAQEVNPNNILDTWKDRKGKFVRTFGMNTQRNKNEWRVTWESIKEHIHTALGMPGIAYEECNEDGCSLTHVEADTFEETVEKQKPYIKTKIIDYILDEANESVDLIQEITDDSFFEQLQSGEIKYVSPLIFPENGGVSVSGIGRADLPIIDAYHWNYVHNAFLKSEPAFGDDIAQVKTTCEGENCQIQMLSAQMAETTTGNQENLQHLKETPLLYRHKGQLHLVAASQCVKDILHKKKESGIEINDQALAIAFSECGESKKANSSFKTCTCDSKQNKMSADENDNLKKENDNLKSKLQAQEDKFEKEKSHGAKRARYGKLFAETNEEDREKMVAKLKAMEDKEEHKAAQEVHDEMKKEAKKGMSDNNHEKEKMKAEIQSMQAELAAPMVAKLLKARSNKITKEELRTYETLLKGKSYTEIKEKFDEQKPLFADSVNDAEANDDNNNFEFNGGNALVGKTFSEIAKGDGP